MAREIISGIYKITNNINGKIYIGCSKNIYYRFSVHKRPSARCLITKAIMKYGVDNFSFEILLKCPSICFDYWEKYYISKYNSISPIGYNLEAGGIVNKIVTDEARRKASERMIGKKQPRYKDSYPAMREAKLGSKNPMYGNGDSRVGDKNPMYGKTFNMTEEAKSTISDKLKGNKNRKKSVSYNGTTYETLKDLANELGINYCSMLTRIKNGRFDGVVYL